MVIQIHTTYILMTDLLLYIYICRCDTKSKYLKTIVKPALVTTSIKQKLVFCDLNFNIPSQCISCQLNLY